MSVFGMRRLPDSSECFSAPYVEKINDARGNECAEWNTYRSSSQSSSPQFGVYRAVSAADRAAKKALGRKKGFEKYIQQLNTSDSDESCSAGRPLARFSECSVGRRGPKKLLERKKDFAPFAFHSIDEQPGSDGSTSFPSSDCSMEACDDGRHLPTLGRSISCSNAASEDSGYRFSEVNDRSLSPSSSEGKSDAAKVTEIPRDAWAVGASPVEHNAFALRFPDNWIMAPSLIRSLSAQDASLYANFR